MRLDKLFEAAQVHFIRIHCIDRFDWTVGPLTKKTRVSRNSVSDHGRKR